MVFELLIIAFICGLLAVITGKGWFAWLSLIIFGVWYLVVISTGIEVNQYGQPKNPKFK